MTARASSESARAAFLEELVRLRVQAGLTPQELAGHLGIKVRDVTRGEAGSRSLGIVELQLWAFACGSTLEQFGRRLSARARQ